VRRAVVVVALATACWHETTAVAPPQPPPSPPSPCAKAVAAMVDALHDEVPPATRSRIVDMLVLRCTEDRWSAGAQTCLVAAKTEPDVRRCGEELTHEQRKRAERAAEAIDPTLRRKKARSDEDGGDARLRVTGLEPDHGDAAGGQYVKIYGNGFTCRGGCALRIKVYFGSRKATVVRIVSDTELIVEAPGGRDNEIVDVLAIFEPGGEIRIARAFTFVPSTP
jgi:hypothetical protein